MPSARPAGEQVPSARPAGEQVERARAARAAGRVAPAQSADRGTQTTEGGRTVAIRGYGTHPPTEQNLPMARPALRRHERPGFRPDRAALWAVLLGLLLILVAAASAHGAVVH